MPKNPKIKPRKTKGPRSNAKARVSATTKRRKRAAIARSSRRANLRRA